METGGAKGAVRWLDEAIDASAIPRKVLAEDYVGVKEPQFSRLVHSAAIEFIDALPDGVVIDWLQRMGRQRAFEVRELSPAELDADVVALIEQLATTLRLRQVRTRPVKAGLRERRVPA